MKYISHDDPETRSDSPVSLEKICPFVDAKHGVKVDEAAINLKKTSYQIIMLGMIKATVSLRFDRNKVEEANIIRG